MRKLDYCFYIGSAESDGKELCYIEDKQGYLFSKEDLLNIANGILNFVLFKSLSYISDNISI